jgi:tetratricopeptide (TPR) repeat protein
VPEGPGERIGSYELVDKLGEGGCGVVYLAEQTEPIRRRVALKVIKLGMDTRQVVARFDAERQALAVMDHPNIARVFEAGATENGRPFFVMELVEGLRITDFCDQHNLTTGERLDLFVQVCRAVQHAHQKGIIHRDLKPSNILVAVQDGKPVPKVIDFGIAKATEQPLTDKTQLTSLQQFLGTPAYMSPEQAGLGGVDVDTRSDIYALGVLLYELLTGHTPFEKSDLLRAGFEQMCRLIRETEPPKPSTRLGLLRAEDLTTVARCQRTEAPRLVHELRGDLDWIVMKCLEKDRARRYETSVGLARDVERHLNHEPVSAAAPGVLYRARKFVRRHRGGLGMAATLLLLLVAGAVVSVWQAVRAKRAERKATMVAAFLQDALNSVSPSVALGRDTTLLREVLDRTAKRIDTGLSRQPEVEAELRGTLGKVYEDIGALTPAEALHRKALALREAVFGKTHPKVADSLSDLGSVLVAQGKPAAAEGLFRRATAIRRAALGRAHPEVASSLSNVGVALVDQGKLGEAEQALREALAIQKDRFGEENADVATSLHNLGNVLWKQGKMAEAEAAFRKVVAIRQKVLEPNHPLLAMTLANLGTVLWSESKFADAETFYRRTLEMQITVMGPEHRDVATTLHNLACVLLSLGKLPEAETTCRTALAMRRKLLGNAHPFTASTLSALETILQSEGNLPEAEAAQREALAIQQKLPDADPLDVGVSFINLGEVLRLEHKLAEAEAAEREALERLTKLLGTEHQYVAAPMNSLANVLRDQGKLAESEALQRRALAMRRKLLGNEHTDVAQSLHDLATVLLAEVNLPEAEQDCRDALAMRKKLLGDAHPDTIASAQLLASVLQARGKSPGASLENRRLSPQGQLAAPNNPTNSPPVATPHPADADRKL